MPKTPIIPARTLLAMPAAPPSRPTRPGSRASRGGRVLECLVLFGILPALLATRWLRAPVLPVLWATSLYCAWRLRRDRGWVPASSGRVAPGEWRRMLVTFLVTAAMLLVLVRVTHPGSLFAFPLRHPLGWAAFLAWYPLLSVLPQEIIFRAFFFSRYRFLFGDGGWLVAGSALAFGLAHLAFHNPVAVALTLPGGLMFARTYRRTGTLLFVSLEHALYGCLVFTIGLGPFLTEHPLRMLH